MQTAARLNRHPHRGGGVQMTRRLQMRLGFLAPSGLRGNLAALTTPVPIRQALVLPCGQHVLLPVACANLKTGKAHGNAGPTTLITTPAVQAMQMQMVPPGTAGAGLRRTTLILACATS